MKEFKGTKGEWKSFYNGYFNEIQLGGTGQFLASTNENKFIDIDAAQDNANAKLIAAAPNLLRELICLVENIEGLGNTGEEMEKLKTKLSDAKNAINKAI